MYSKRVDFQTEDYDKLSISQLKRLADYWFRQYLLHIAVKDNYNRIFCQFTNKWLKEDDLHVCHYIDRGRSTLLRYSTDNCILGSKNSNMWEAKEPAEGHKSLHHKKFYDILGEKNVEKLLQISKENHIFGREDYIKKIEQWRKNIHS